MCEPPLSQLTPGLHPALPKTQELSDPFQPKPFHGSSGANAKSSCPQSSPQPPYQGLQLQGLERKTRTVWRQKCHTPPGEQCPAAQGNAPRAANSSAAPGIQTQGIGTPRDKAQQAETQGKGSRCCRNLAALSDSDLHCTPAFALLHCAGCKALFALMKEMPLCNVREDQSKNNNSSLCRNLRNKTRGQEKLLCLLLEN